MLAERSSALFAVVFSTSPAGTATITTDRSSPVSLGSPPDTTGNLGEITSAAFEQVGVTAVLTNDIDGDGMASPLTDGLLLVRYLEGRTGSQLTEGALGAHATRTDPDALINFIEDVVEKSLLQVDPQTQISTVRSTLDFDGDGNTDANDAGLLARYLAGFRGSALTNFRPISSPRRRLSR